MNMKTKICTKCKQSLPATKEFFYVAKHYSDGLRSWCRECKRQQNREYYLKNLEKHKQHGREWRKNNPEKCKRYGRKWRKNNSEKHRQQNCEWRENNPEWNHNWQKKNPDKCNINNAKRKARKRNQTPILIKNEIKKIELYYRISEHMGPDWEVDHIIPISKGGLHHPDNLQIVTKEYNRQKHNKLNFRDPKPMEYFRI